MRPLSGGRANRNERDQEQHHRSGSGWSRGGGYLMSHFHLSEGQDRQLVEERGSR